MMKNKPLQEYLLAESQKFADFKKQNPSQKVQLPDLSGSNKKGSFKKHYKQGRKKVGEAAEEGEIHELSVFKELRENLKQFGELIGQLEETGVEASDFGIYENGKAKALGKRLLHHLQ